MKFNVSLALRTAVVAAVCAASANAFAFGGLFESGLFKNISSSSAVVADDSFFGGEALTLGDMGAAEFGGYEASATDFAYGDCAECNQGGVYDAPIVSYDYGYDGYVYDGGYVDSYGWAPARSFTPIRSALRAGGAVLRGVRNFLFGRFDYCQPAYVCDPCWSVCDPCCDPCFDSCCDWSPCAPACNPCAPMCEPCAPACEPCQPACNTGAVYAPSSCCGNGYAPGQTRPLNAQTGRPENGVDSTLTALPEADKAPAQDVAPAQDKANLPATPGLDDESELPSYNSEAPEDIPTPAPSTGAGLIKMLVPEDSVVYVNGYRTKQTGAMRSFAAKNLQRGETYSFEIRVVAVRNGRTFEDVQTTTLTAGDSTALAFNLTLRDNEAYALNK